MVLTKEIILFIGVALSFFTCQHKEENANQNESTVIIGDRLQTNPMLELNHSFTYSNFSADILPNFIRSKTGQTIELQNLYSNPVFELPIDSLESLIIVQDLKERGFIVVDWGRGNFMQGPRMVAITAKKEDCYCEVIKKYYSPLKSEIGFVLTESIRCMDSLHYYSP